MNQKKQDESWNLRQLPLLGYKLLIFLGAIFILVVCIEYAQIVYINNILPDKMVKENYTQTTCTIMSKQLSQKGRLVHRYRADFLLSYTAHNNPYKTWVTGNGLDQAFSHKREPQEETLAQFEVGAAYPCWYNPVTPQIAVLVMRHNWASTLPLAVPTIVGFIAIYYIIKALFQFLGVIFYTIESKNRLKK